MTKKLFWKDPYLTECKAMVTSMEGNKVKLDQTIFYAFSGGQESDEGTINGIKVVNAVKQGEKENIIDIEYELEKVPDFKVGDEVEVKIDKEKRDKLRRLHSAAHIVYYFVTSSLGRLRIIGSNIASEKARFDFLYNKPISDLLPMIEEQVNPFLAEGHEIITEPDEKNPDMRWWRCYEWSMPCGGTHVKNTKEIGKIRLKRKNIGADKERIEIYLE
ncbi:alanyl-tRNA editing protein [Candidatus Woesearchaeota archaeon]|nr:alanyl-tRNA editing protein [Candidatus Woesearchaeota archaeon]